MMRLLSHASVPSRKFFPPPGIMAQGARSSPGPAPFFVVFRQEWQLIGRFRGLLSHPEPKLAATAIAVFL